MDGLINEVVSSVRERGFLDALPSRLAQKPEVMETVLRVMGQLGQVASRLYHDDAEGASLAAAEAALALQTLSVAVQRYGHGTTGDKVTAPAARDGLLMWQILKAIEESGEFAEALASERTIDAGSELADWLITLCSTGNRLQRHVLTFDLEEWVRDKISQDAQRGLLHGLRIETSGNVGIGG